jgi:hypothetical protein
MTKRNLDLLTTLVLVAIGVGFLYLWQKQSSPGKSIVPKSEEAVTTVAGDPFLAPVIPKSLPARCDSAQSLKLVSGNYAGLVLAADGAFWIGHDSQVEKLGKDGRILATIAIGTPVHAVAVVNETLLLAAGQDRIFRLEKSGEEWKVIAWEPLAPKSYITALAIAEDRVLVADAGDRAVSALDLKTGKALWKTTGEAGFAVPSPYFALTVNPDGNLWVVNPAHHRMESYGVADGRFIANWKPDGVTFSGCCNPALMVGLAGDRFVTFEKGPQVLQVFAPSGKLLVKLAGTEEFFSGTFSYAMAVDAKECLYLLDDHRDMILCFPNLK